MTALLSCSADVRVHVQRRRSKVRRSRGSSRPRPWARPGPTIVILLWLCACGSIGAPGGAVVAHGCGRLVARGWPAADRLFHQDPRWLGADAAFSVDLGDDRVLWLFGDTFVATSERCLRSEARMVRNSIALQHGRDPSRATIEFGWGDGPGSWFSDQGERWFWPQHGVRVPGGPLVLF